jgi:hypothetical protein
MSSAEPDGGPVMDPDVAEMLLGLLGQASLRTTDPDLIANAERAHRATRQLTALTRRQAEAPPPADR